MTASRAARPQAGEARHHAPERVSHVAENYLLSLFVLYEEGMWPTPAQFADYLRRLPAGEGLGTSLPSVLAMVRRMVKDGLVEMSPEKRVRLTKRGNARAEEIVRRHRLAECMVVDLLGLELHKAHVEAHRLEHAISPDVEAKIREKLSNPTTCPFGRPIPGSGYREPMGRQLAMTEAESGHRLVVDRIPEEDQELLRFLIERGMVPGQEVTVVEAGHFRGVITFRTSQGEAALGVEAASRIWLREHSPAR